MADLPQMFDALTDPVVGAIRGSAANVLLVMILLYSRGRHTVGVDELARVSKISKNSIHDALLTLRDYGLVDQSGRYDGWHLLTGGVRQLPIPADLLEDGSRKICDSRAAPVHQVIEVESKNLRLDFSGAETPESESSTPAENESQIPTPTRNFPAQNESESKNLRLPDNVLSSCFKTDSEPEKEKQLQKQGEARAALLATGLAEYQVDDFLARYAPDWLSTCCDWYEWARHTPKRGGGTYADKVSWLIHAITKPYTTPSGYIPRSERCPDCYRRTTDHAFDCPQLRVSLEGSPGSTPVFVPPSSPECDSTVREAWQAVRGQLQRNGLPRQDFEARVRVLAPLGLAEDGARQVFRLAAPDAYTQGWCASRLSGTLARLLSGWFGQETSVEFVVYPAESG